MIFGKISVFCHLQFAVDELHDPFGHESVQMGLIIVERSEAAPMGAITIIDRPFPKTRSNL